MINVKKPTKQQVKEVRELFAKHYPAQHKVVFETKDSYMIKYSATQWHVFKCGYFAGKGLLS